MFLDMALEGDRAIADDVLLLLGQIKGVGEETNKKVDRIDTKVDIVTAQSIRTESAAQAAHRRIDEIKPMVDRHENIISQGQGAITGASHVAHVGWILVCAILSGLATLAGIFLF